MTIKEAHYQFKLNMDRVDTLATEDFNRAEIDWLLNEAQLIFIKQRMSDKSNPKRLGFEDTQKRIDDLSTLVIKYPSQPPILTELLDTGVYEVNLSTTVFPYMYLISAWTQLNLGNNCYKDVTLKFTQHDDYRIGMRDPFNKPSLESIPYNFGRSSTGDAVSIYVYSGDLPSSYINSVYIEYIKKPRKVSLGNYTYIDGTIYPPTTFELPEQTHSEIVDIACQIASLSIENPEYIQLKTQKAFIHE